MQRRRDSFAAASLEYSTVASLAPTRLREAVLMRDLPLSLLSFDDDDEEETDCDPIFSGDLGWSDLAISASCCLLVLSDIVFFFRQEKSQYSFALFKSES